MDFVVMGLRDLCKPRWVVVVVVGENVVVGVLLPSSPSASVGLCTHRRKLLGEQRVRGQISRQESLFILLAQAWFS